MEVIPIRLQRVVRAVTCASVERLVALEESAGTLGLFVRGFSRALFHRRAHRRDSPSRRTRARSRGRRLDSYRIPFGIYLDSVLIPLTFQVGSTCSFDLSATRVPLEEVVDGIAVTVLSLMPQTDSHQPLGVLHRLREVHRQRGQHGLWNRPVCQVLSAVADPTEPEPRRGRSGLCDLRVRAYSVIDPKPGHQALISDGIVMAPKRSNTSIAQSRPRVLISSYEKCSTVQPAICKARSRAFRSATCVGVLS
jgi:hypothetical protein